MVHFYVIWGFMGGKMLKKLIGAASATRARSFVQFFLAYSSGPKHLILN